jgi:acetyl esterase/lipase
MEKMKVYKVDLSKEYPFLKGGSLDCMLADCPMDGENANGWKRPALISVAGGGYACVSKREAEPVALAFLARGFQVFSLTYSYGCEDARYPEQLLQLAAAVDYVRKHAKELSVNPDEIFAVGFSAGGHLTGNLAVEYASVTEKAGVQLDCRPTAVGLCYPVISHKGGHFGSYENLLKGYTEEAKGELFKTLDLNEAVTKDTPPAFIWATADDQVVPADNAIRYAQALANCGVEYELHIYPHGPHGFSTASLEINAPHEGLARAARWVDDCATFFRQYTVERF